MNNDSSTYNYNIKVRSCMVNSMLEEKGISFKEIEQEILERYDGKLHEERNVLS